MALTAANFAGSFTPVTRVEACWCGNRQLEAFSSDYVRCSACDTLVVARMPDARTLVVDEEENGLYGRTYYESYLVNNFGFPSLQERARSELSERCVHWLGTLLKYKAPPARTLELGSGHGGFVAMLRAAGFDATGLELSPWLAGFARNTFDVPMLVGPLEQQDLEPDSFDAIILMDVVEHLPDPECTLRICMKLLKIGGMLLIQTPRYREGKSLEAMHDSDDPFLVQLKADQHLFLFSRRSINLLLDRIGAKHIAFEPAIFSSYDMFLAATSSAPAVRSKAEARDVLNSGSIPRLMGALVDACAQVDDVRLRLAESEQDRGARLEVIEKQGRQLAESEADRAARLEVIVEQARSLAETESELRQQVTDRQREIEDNQERIEASEALLSRMRRSLPFRAMRKAGMVKWLDPDRPGGQGKLEKVAVDLTPLLPGADNGGAKVMTLELIRQLAQIAPECEFILLTSEHSHEELAALDSANVRRVLVNKTGAGLLDASLARMSSHRVLRLLRRASGLVAEKIGPGGRLLREMSADLLFCPFTAPFYYDPAVPVVSVVYDLQYAQYPEFFAPAEREGREEHFRKACRVAHKLVCISGHVRSTVLDRSGLNPNRVCAIPIQLQNRLPKPAVGEITEIAGRYQIVPGRFLLYPANFWPHKNHEMLLTAFGMFCSEEPDTGLKLVLTGSPGPRMQELSEASRRMGFEDRIVFPGHLPEGEFSALLSSCLAVIFPSLYEGFGMPVLEAMAAGKPVLCSNATSLPEVAGDAALLFDPRRPREIVDAIKRIANDRLLVVALAEKGRRRASVFGSPRAMATAYMRVFREAVPNRRQLSSRIHGVWDDGWTGERVTITFERAAQPRHIEIELYAPEWIPIERLVFHFPPGSNGQRDTKTLKRGRRLLVKRPLYGRADRFEMVCDTLFQPSACGLGDDSRLLGCQFVSAKIMDYYGTLVRVTPGDNGP